jgi:hypothetical protein
MRAAPWIIGGVGLGAMALLFFSRKASASVPGIDSAPSSTLLQDVLTMVGPRGIRNNNPGNIRRTADLWQGMADVQDDPAFVQFTSPEYGIRAMSVILANYRRAGRNTVRKIITRWAPSNENDTEAYVNAVAASLGIDPDQQLGDGDMPLLIAAIIKHENGVQPYDIALIEQGVSLA